jgi:hypothetical protein
VQLVHHQGGLPLVAGAAEGVAEVTQAGAEVVGGVEEEGGEEQEHLLHLMGECQLQAWVPACG